MHRNISIFLSKAGLEKTEVTFKGHWKLYSIKNIKKCVIEPS